MNSLHWYDDMRDIFMDKPVKQYKRPRDSKILDYSVNVYKGDTFVVCYRYEGWSGTAVHDAVKDLRRTYPHPEYTLDW